MDHNNDNLCDDWGCEENGIDSIANFEKQKGIECSHCHTKMSISFEVYNTRLFKINNKDKDTEFLCFTSNENRLKYFDSYFCEKCVIDLINMKFIKKVSQECVICKKMPLDPLSNEIFNNHVHCSSESKYDDIDGNSCCFFAEFCVNLYEYGRYMCDECIDKLIIDEVIEIDYDIPWRWFISYNIDNSICIDGCKCINKCKNKKFQNKRLPITIFRNKYGNFKNIDELKLFEYPFCARNYLHIKKNPQFFGSYSQIIADRLPNYFETYIQQMYESSEYFKGFDCCELCSSKIIPKQSTFNKQEKTIHFCQGSIFYYVCLDHELKVHAKSDICENKKSLCDTCLIEKIYSNELYFNYAKPKKDLIPRREFICYELLLDITKFSTN